MTHCLRRKEEEVVEEEEMKAVEVGT